MAVVSPSLWIPGDGVGKEITDSVRTIFEAENILIDWETINIKQTDHMKANKIGLKGLWHTPADQTGSRFTKRCLCKQLDIYANVALFKSLKGVKTRIPDIDLTPEKTRRVSSQA
ncbi:BBT_HP_G0133400.mRNA.1.CDS.1 [Saccharomyces cerevisiae]|nr:BBT_HP_G0133400.mRNA.1.CDS.1 [Saccharomyces cerevisiae]CAI6977066.1 BBT_HP_G0133400.mRNA.1.CDS.1 [Saccharomyces cerevisiae]